jgi:LysW-gamma-L-lysine carboxypeptidase
MRGEAKTVLVPWEGPGPRDDEAEALLTEMVAIPSVSGSEGALAEFLATSMQALGYRTEVDAAGNAVGHIGAGKPHIVLLGHMDTVAGDIPVRREGRLLYGRGTVDAKGPLAAFIAAAARAADGLRARVTVIGAVEEEAATSKGAYFAVGRYSPDYCVIGEPSGWDRITIGYKGRLLIDYVLERAVSHTAGRERAPAEEAVDVWRHVAEWAEAYNRDKEGTFATLDPSLRRICSGGDGLRERVEMTIALRLPLGLHLPDLLNPLMDTWARHPDGAARVVTRGHEAPFRAEKRTPLASAFLAGIRAEGGRPAYVTKTGTSDMNVVGPRWRCPIVAYGPGDSAYDHAPDEHIDLGEYLQSVRVLTRVLNRLGGA